LQPAGFVQVMEDGSRERDQPGHHLLRVVRLGEGKAMTAAESRHREPKLLDAGGFQPEISSFRLQLAAEGKAAKTVRTYTEAVRWFAAAHLRRQASCTRWEQVGRQDVQRSSPARTCRGWSGPARAARSSSGAMPR
jgi:hypothetical protein